ncbi:MAG TPA: NUDIX domain-containing protein [Elusimicrobiota bacterium]|nr:NUDIX domain-containing protein [Elusimicrobiota bacterium]
MSAAKEFSAGGVVGRGGKVLLVEVENLKGEIVWTFPKGHLEKGETWLAAGLREVEEETGWKCRSLGLLSNVTYFFRRNEKLVFKRVRWFRMEPVRKTGKPDAKEIRRTRWVDAEKAVDLLAYPGDHRLLARYMGK